MDAIALEFNELQHQLPPSPETDAGLVVETECAFQPQLARLGTHDPLYLHLKEHPDQVKEWLEAGKP
jgi:hypothetical protein